MEGEVAAAGRSDRGKSTTSPGRAGSPPEHRPDPGSPAGLPSREEAPWEGCAGYQAEPIG